MTPAAGQPQGYQITGEFEFSQTGFSVSGAGDFNNDGNEDYLVGAPLAGLGAGAAYLVFGQGTPIAGDELALSALTGPNGFQMNGAADDRAGRSVSSAGDVNGDGFSDIAVGAHLADPNGAYSGAAYVVFGKSSGFADLNLDALAAGGFRVFAGAGDYTGISVSDAGDVDGDGFGDLLVGAHGYNAGEGAAFVVYGRATGLTGDIDLTAMTSTVGVRITGEGASLMAARSVSSAGDVNGDGIDDLLVGDRGASGEAAGSGAAYLVYGQAGEFGGNIDLGSLGGLGVKLNGEATGVETAFSISSAGDVNADGFDDLIVGAVEADGGNGAAYVVFGSGALGATIDLSALDGDTGFRLTGATDRAGWSVSSAGDVNGDGYADLIVGAPIGGGGKAYVVFGKAAGFAADLDMTAIASPDGFRILGEASADYAGGAVSSAGDINGDGYDDLMVGAYNFGGDDRGAGYIIFGSPTIGGSVDNVDFDGDTFANTDANTTGDQTWVGGRDNDRWAVIGALVNGGADVMHGGQGADLMEVPDLAFMLADGGTGSDTLLFTAGVTMVDADFRKIQEMETLRLEDATFDITLGQNADRAFSGRNLTIDGTLITNSAVSIDGADMLQSLSADFRNNATSIFLQGGDGSDTLRGGSGADDIGGGGGADSMIGGDGDDRLAGGADNDTLNGGEGADTADYGGGAAVSVNLSLAGAQNTGGGGVDRLASVENLIGTAGADSLTGAGSDNRLAGEGGGDTLAGAGGADTLDGSGGADSLAGGAHDDLVLAGFGADVMSGGSGVDTLDYSSASFVFETFLDLADTTAQNTHSAGADTMIGFENVLTADGNDRIRGTGADNRFESFGGADTLKSKDGSDVLLAGGGDDRINAGAGDDLVIGGLGRDFLRGGLGSDDFIYEDAAESGVGVALADVIRDFRTSDGDRIDLSGVFAGQLVYIGGANFSGLGPGEVRVAVVAEGQLVQVDLDGDAVSDMDILVTNSGLSGGAADFVL
jgi:hypothetical protein